MLKIKKIISKLLSDDMPIQQKMLNLMLPVAVLAGFIALLGSCLMDFNSLANLAIAVVDIVLIFSLLFSIIFNKYKVSAIIFLIAINSILFPVLFFYSGGIYSGMPVWMLSGLVMAWLFLIGISRYIVFSINLITDLTCIIISVKFPNIVQPIEGYVEVAFDVAMALTISSCIFAVIFKFQIDNYETQKKKIKETEEEAIKATKAKSVFLSNMTHDIRTPMNAILGYIEIAKSNIDDKKKLEDCLSKTTVATEHLLNLINNVLDMSKIESGKLSLDDRPCDLFMIFEDVFTILRPEFFRKGIEVVKDMNGLVYPLVKTDRLRMNQILINLLNNSIKYSSSQSHIYVTVSQKEITNGRIPTKIVIRDEGYGMSEEFLQRVFEPFERERNTTNSGEMGTGLGLVITKNLVEIMGGKLELNSQENVGTELIISIDFQVGSALPEVPAAGDKKIDFTGKRVLLVEDNDFNREIATELLHSVGFTVDEATDGTYAIEKVRVSKNGFYDLILMDIQMPIMDGYKATTIIRSFENKAIAEIPIIALTANAFIEDRFKAFEYGMDGYITKPIKLKELCETISSILDAK
ncbi:MAG: response regulator [Treponema sp.]|nr:response regulator [Treponema sp.]